MGNYTELIFGARLKENTPQHVIDRLHLMLEGDTEERSPLVGGSYYFAVSDSVNKMWYDENMRQWSISSRANIKNYHREIEKFLEWIKPYIDNASGVSNMYAIVMYEEDRVPKIYYLDDATTQS